MKPMKIAIIGAPGSGKSTLALRLSKLLSLPVYHLDNYMFDSSGNKVEKASFLSQKEKMINNDKWIIEGCSISTLSMRFSKADLIIYLDFTPWVCLYRIIKRFIFMPKKLKGTGCLQGVNMRLFIYILFFRKRKRPTILNEIKLSNKKFFIINNNKKLLELFNNLY